MQENSLWESICTDAGRSPSDVGADRFPQTVFLHTLPLGASSPSRAALGYSQSSRWEAPLEREEAPLLHRIRGPFSTWWQVKDSNLRSFRDGFTDHRLQTRDQPKRLTRQHLRGVFPADSRRQPTSAVANRTRNRLPSRRLLTGQSGLLVRNQVPAWPSFVPEIVSTDLVATAVSLNNSMVNVAPRTVGPALAGVLIVSLGSAPASSSTRGRSYRSSSRVPL